MNILAIAKPTFTESFIKPFLKLIVSLVLAFIGSSLAGIAVCFILFLIIFIIGIIKGTLGNTLGSIILLPLVTAFFTFMYGILAPIFSAIQIIVFGVPAAFVGWKFKLIRWWTCSLGGVLLSISPWALFYMLGTILKSSTGDIPSLNETIIGAGIFWTLGFCGGVGGLCFWLTLRLLHFEDINGPITYPIQFPR